MLLSLYREVIIIRLCKSDYSLMMTNLCRSCKYHTLLTHAIRCEEDRILGYVGYEGWDGACIEAPHAVPPEGIYSAGEHGPVEGREGLHLHLHRVHGLSCEHRHCGTCITAN